MEYGAIGDSNDGKEKTLSAHRVAYELFVGPIPPGQCVLHHCDNPSCVRPCHLFLGTLLDNNLDMLLKGRTARGEKSGAAKLNDKLVYDILSLRGTLSHVAIAKQVSISRSVVSEIIEGKAWKHLPRS